MAATGPTPPVPGDALGAADVLRATSLIKTGAVYDLDCGRWPGMPLWHGHPPFQVLAYRTPHGIEIEGDQTWLGSNEVGYRWHSDLVMGTVHSGTHIDALCHVTCGRDNHWYGGVSANAHTGDFGPLRNDAMSMPSLVGRGVLIDVAGSRGVEALPAHEPIGADELRRALERQGTTLEKGDVVLVRTGYLAHWPDPDGIAAHADAGINLEAAEFLLGAGCAAIGGDTESLECLPSNADGDPLPVHRVVLIEHGVYILEMVYCEELARDRVYEFCFVCLPLKIRYATGSMVRPIALV